MKVPGSDRTARLNELVQGEMVWDAAIFEPGGGRVASFSCTQRIRPSADEEVLEFMTLDVFGDRFAGNPLAVVFGADDLEEEEMFRITREFNYSETVFVSSSESSRYPVRIFTPRLEVPFAGHPTIGAAVAIAIRTGARHPILVEKIGDVAVEAALVAPGIGSASFEVPRVAEPGPSFDISPARVMDAIGLDERDLDQDRRITYYDGGIRFVLIPLRNEEAVSRARLDLGAWREAFEHAWTSQLYLVARRQEPDEFRVRLFAPGMGVSEDPATGSAAAVLGRYVADQRGEGRHELVIRQGDEIGRASRIGVIADKDHHGALRVFVSGFATLTMKGKLIRSGSRIGALGENRS